jgi:hypothetical protein
MDSKNATIIYRYANGNPYTFEWDMMPVYRQPVVLDGKDQVLCIDHKTTLAYLLQMLADQNQKTIRWNVEGCSFGHFVHPSLPQDRHVTEKMEHERIVSHFEFDEAARAAERSQYGIVKVSSLRWVITKRRSVYTIGSGPQKVGFGESEAIRKATNWADASMEYGKLRREEDDANGKDVVGVIMKKKGK